MKVYQVTTEQEAKQAYPCATVVPSPFWADGLPLSRAWFAENLGQYIEGFHLADDTDQVIGHIYWASSEKALAPYQIEDVEGYKGVLVDGTNFEGYMHYKHFIKRGFQVAQENDRGKLLYLPRELYSKSN